MKPLAAALAIFLAVSPTVFAHEGNDHVRGVVTQISPTSITVQTADKKTRTLTLSAKTAFEKSGDHAGVGDLKVGDRVIVDVPQHTAEAKLVRFGTPKKK